MQRKLRKVKQYARVSGVCAGVAYWLGIPVWLVRFALILSFLFNGIGVIAYILLWIFMPEWEETPKDYSQVTGN